MSDTSPSPMSDLIRQAAGRHSVTFAPERRGTSSHGAAVASIRQALADADDSEGEALRQALREELDAHGGGA